MNIDISIENDSWNSIDTDSITKACVDATFETLKISKSNLEICVLFTSDDDIRTLNKTFRGVDSATNVLSFPATPIDECCDDDEECEHDDILGSIAVAYETVEREAKEQNKTFEHHLHHMLVHSILHLLGYDHIDDKEANAMEEWEVKILQSLHIANPYQ